jgi:hypothetical protein
VNAPDELHGRDVTNTAFHDWLLSDHPAAKAERDNRRAASYQAESAHATSPFSASDGAPGRRAWSSRERPS